MIAYCGSANAVWHASSGRLKKIPGVGDQIVALVRTADSLSRAEKELTKSDEAGIACLCYWDTSYPKLLSYIYDAPLYIFKKGNIEFNEQENIAIVGTRKPTETGRCIAETFASFYAEKGINVVSGLAFGIDFAVHRAAIDSGGKTTAVLGHGLDTIYPPQHSSKAREMLEKGGWISEYFVGTAPEAVHFPARNRIIAGMSKAVIVIEAAESGGALITAHMAFDQNREVYAIPGRLSDKKSVGCNRLIRDQVAKLVTSPEEVLEDLEIQWKERPTQSAVQVQLELDIPTDLTTEERKILNVLNKQDAVIDQIRSLTGISMQKLQSLLLTMEFKGWVVQAPGKRFRIK